MSLRDRSRDGGQLARHHPLDEERAVEMEVTLSFVALALTDPTLRQAYEQTQVVLREICARALTHLGAPYHAVNMTHAVVDGLALHLLSQAECRDTTWATEALDVHLQALEALVAH